MKIILASASPRRSALLKQAGIKFLVRPSRFDESLVRGTPRVRVLQAAQAKAAEVAARQRTPAWILGADTLVVQGRQIFGKPANPAQAAAMLAVLSGREHRVLTGVAWIRVPDGKKKSWVSETRVKMRPLSRAEIAAYVASREWRGKAGGYAIQGRAGGFVTRLGGCYANVVGLPLGAVAEFIKREKLAP